jgi:hypothetical protein
MEDSHLWEGASSVPATSRRFTLFHVLRNDCGPEGEVPSGSGVTSVGVRLPGREAEHSLKHSVE